MLGNNQQSRIIQYCLLHVIVHKRFFMTLMANPSRSVLLEGRETTISPDARQLNLMSI